jgi:hypothetical protein
MRSISETIESFLKQKRIRYWQVDQSGAFRWDFEDENGSFRSYIDARDRERSVRVYTLAPVTVPKRRRMQVAELLTRINEHFAFGYFGLGMDDGVVLFKTSIILGRSSLHDDVMQYLLHAHCWAMSQYFPALSMVAVGDIAPKHAIDIVGQKQEPKGRDEADPEGVLDGPPDDILRALMN